MRNLILCLGAALLAGAPATAKPRLTPEAELAEALVGRVPGKPVRCITTSNARSVQIIDRTALIYQIGSTLYVNRSYNADQLDSWDILVTRMFSGQLCRPDIVRLYDSGARFETGFVTLGNFVPYRRVRQPNR